MTSAVMTTGLPRSGLRQLAGDKGAADAESRRPRLDALLLATPGGLMLRGWLREQGKFDPDSVTAMLSAVSEFVRDSMGAATEDGPWRAQTISVGPRTVVQVSAGEVTATAVVSGKPTPELGGELKRLVCRCDHWYGSEAPPEGGWVDSPRLRQEFDVSLARLA